MKHKISIGTRRSPLAIWQAEWVARLLEDAGHPCELVPMDTKGDRMLKVAIPEIGSKGVFTEDLEKELEKGTIDLAVHSAKDMPSELPLGFELIAFTEREGAHDVLVSYDEALDHQSDLIIGTSSTRRVALIGRHYPQFTCTSVRGNLQTRLKKLRSGQMDALLLAYAGVHRLGLDNLIRHSFTIDDFVPAVGQGSMAIEVSQSISQAKKSLIREVINHQPTEICLLAERAFLFTIQGGCSIPAFAHARLYGDAITIQGGIIALNGEEMVKQKLSGPIANATELGTKLGRSVLDAGGAKILEDIKWQMNKRNETNS